jgi:hypothetical protein
VLRNLLAYLSDKALSGTADNLKEYTIGLDALGKPASFDPRQESVVRMHTARLRQKLAEYYRNEGIDDPIISICRRAGSRSLSSRASRPLNRIWRHLHRSSRSILPGVAGIPVKSF